MSPRPRAFPALLVAAFLASAGESALAQTCAGLPSLREYPLVLGATYLHAPSTSSAGGTVTWGRRAFGSLDVSYATYPDIAFAANSDEDAHSVELGLVGGYEFTPHIEIAGRPAEIGLCPLVLAGYETGPDAGSLGLDAYGYSVGAGLGVGGTLFRSDRTRVIPFAGISVLRASTVVRDVPFVGTNSKDTETGGVFALGVGLVFGRLTLSPAASRSFGVDEPEWRYGADISLSLGHGRTEHP